MPQASHAVFRRSGCDCDCDYMAEIDIYGVVRVTFSRRHGARICCHVIVSSSRLLLLQHRRRYYESVTRTRAERACWNQFRRHTVHAAACIDHCDVSIRVHSGRRT